jgi:uncharacterized protein involved in exopolysaccharide biosynthesis
LKDGMTVLSELPHVTRLRSDPDEIDPKEMLALLRRRKWTVLSVTASCTIAAFVITSLLPGSYKATIVVAPVTVTPGGERGTLGGLGSALAGLAGIAAGGDEKKYESVAVLQSQALIEKYIQEQHLLPVLYPRPDRHEPPTTWQATQYFSKRILSVTLDAKTGLVTLSISWKDPVQAAKWANDLVRLSNDYLRGRAMEQSDKNIAYLSAEAEKATVVQVKASVYEMLGAEIRRGMLARGNEEYAFKILDPALVPESPSSLPPWAWAVIATVCGFIFSVVAILAKVGWETSAPGAVRRE